MGAPVGVYYLTVNVNDEGQRDEHVRRVTSEPLTDGRIGRSAERGVLW